MGKYVAIIILTLCVLQANAWNEPKANKNGTGVAGLAAGCTPATSLNELKVNNVKAEYSTGGDFWWNEAASYEIPKESGKHSMYAGSLWLAGTDISGQLKAAAMVYRANGNEFWPGPLSTVNAEISAQTCTDYDKQFKTTRDEVSQFRGWFLAGEFDQQHGTTTQADAYPGYTIPNSILDWPAHGRTFEPYNEDLYLAPFTDVDGDGVYNPASGDYPGYDLDGTADCSERKLSVYGDHNMWWIFNDKGNIHTSTGSSSIGMEIRAQAFGFATNDEVNNMTFMNFELINRSTFTLTQTYFGVFADTDIGGYDDDYVGCDVMKGLGYAYNGDNDDQSGNGASGYLNRPPAIGIDFFEGPYQDNDGIANAYGIGPNEALNGIGYGDSIADNERFGMRRFVYFNRATGPAVMQDPTNGGEYYNYLKGIWKNGNQMVHGGTGYTADGSGTPTAFMMPGTSDDEFNWGTNGVDPGYNAPGGWTEENEQNPAGDRRFIQSAGPFTLTPGAVNDITVGVVWAQSSSGEAFESVKELLRADAKTQALFDNCFRVLNPPEAPTLTFQEMDQSLIVYIDNPSISNNYNESYAMPSTFIVVPDSIDTNADGIVDYALSETEKTAYSTYHFQGYKVYQVKDKTVGISDLGDIDRARLVFQCDIKDSIDRIINYPYDKDLNATIPKEMVDGENEGIRHSFLLTEDKFASGDKQLVNHKTYCYIAVAYAYNNFKQYDPLNHSADAQIEPYISSRKGAMGPVESVCAIPHITKVENGGSQPNSVYGEMVDVTRIEGIGNGGFNLRMNEASIDEIMSGAPWKVENPVYEKGFTPIEVKVIDPLNVVGGGDFTVKFKDTTTPGELDDATWVLYNSAGDSVGGSGSGIKHYNEQLLFDYGISIGTVNTNSPMDVIEDDAKNGYINASITFEDGSLPWLGGVNDMDGPTDFNWIRVGNATDENDPEWNDWQNRDIVPLAFVDETQVYENLLDGTWAPGYVTAGQTHGPMSPDADLDFYYNGSPGVFPGLAYLHSVNVVFTDDKSLWTRCPVLEMQADSNVSENRGWKGLPRMRPSVDKDGNAATWDHTTDPSTWAAGSTSESDADYISPYGMGWFPGYAIDIETGERLNMAFGEDSWLEQDNGADMKWNPSSNVVEGPFSNIRGGGKHFIFVFRNNVVEEDFLASGPPDVTAFNKAENRMPGYDAGAFAMGVYKNAEDAKRDNSTNKITNCHKAMINNYRACMWVGYPLLNPGQTLLATEATVRLRVQTPFESYGSQEPMDADESLSARTTYFVRQGPITHDGVTYSAGDHFTAVDGSISPTSDDSIDVVVPTVNDGLPMYQFNIDHLAATSDDAALALEALELINIVPNPYYAYSEYEKDRLDNRVKIVNLPDRCDIKIFTVSGSLIREFSKDDPSITSVDWNLKNHINVPISSGMYIIHVNVPDVGERVLKWFGVIRPVDLDSF